MNFKKYLLFFCVFLNSQLLFSQSVSFGWAKEFESNRVYGMGVSIAIDSKKNVYTAGIFSGTADLDPGPGTFNLTATNVDLFVSKLDSLGNLVWAKQIAGNTEIIPYAMGIDNQDNIYFTGHFKGTTDFDPNPGVFNLTATSHDIFICKLTNSGNFVFAKRFPGTVSYCCDYTRSIVIDEDRNIYTSGSFNGTVDFDPNAGIFNLTSSSADIFVSKLDSLGNFIWAKQMGGAGIDQAYSLKIDHSGNILTTGSFKGTADFDPDNSIYNLTSVSSQDIFVSKLDPSGNFIWAKRFGGGGGAFDIGKSLAVDTNGNIFTTGLFFGTADFDPGPAVYNITSPGSSDVFISKLDSNGNFVWVKHMGSGGNVVGNSICTDQSGNVYTTGYYSNGVDFDPNAGVFYLNCSNLTSNTFISKLDNNGNFVFAKSFWNYTNNSQPYGSDIEIDPQGNLYIGGYYKGMPDFDPNAGVFTMNSPNFDNSFVVKLNQCTFPSSPVITTPVANLIVCSGKSATLSATSNGLVNWYISPSGTTPVYSGNTVTTFPLYGSTYTFYAQAYTCDAGPIMAPVTVTINATPSITANNGSICRGDSFSIIPSGANTYSISGGSSIVSPTINTTYIVTGMSVNGCTNTANSNVSIIPSPIISVNSGTICSGKSFTMHPSGADYYTYSSGSAVVSPTSNATYTVTGTNWQGCQSVNAAVSSVGVKPVPSVMALSNNSLLCTGNSATLTATGALSYSWSTGSGTPIIVVSPLITTNYTVTGSTYFGCTNSYSLTQYVSPCIGIQELKDDQQSCMIFPNPISDHLYVELLVTGDSAKLELYNSTGELVLSTRLNSASALISCGHLANGIYFAKIIIDNTSHLQKIMKQ